jgi:hypothetical protein
MSISITMKSETTVKDRGERAILRELESIGRGVSITTGVHLPEGGQLPRYRGQIDGETPIAQYAFWQEYGTVKIPPRPTFGPTVTSNANLFLKQTRFGMIKIYNGTGTVKGLMKLQGVRIRRWLRSSIYNLSTPANSPKTIRTKRRKGRGTNPLLFSRSFYNSITSKGHSAGGRGGGRKLSTISRKVEKLARRSRL